MRNSTKHSLFRPRPKRMWKKKHSRFQHIADFFYQLLLPLIIFQFIRTLLLPTAFDFFLLAAFVIIYMFHWLK